MKKLVHGIVKFREEILPRYRDTFAKLALGQSPDALFIGCSDSRVAVNVFASTDPGDLFVVRNVGNMVPPCGGEHGQSSADESEAAALEFAVENLKVSNIIVCGHSECGAMQALMAGRENVKSPNLRSWLSHGEGADENRNVLDQKSLDNLSAHNRYSQYNVIHQLEHLKSYPLIQKKVQEGKLHLHGWWFELKNADVYAFEETEKRFVLFDEEVSQKVLKKCGLL